MIARRLDRIRDPHYLVGVEARPSESLRTMRDECVELETEASYLRRLAQGRIDILRAERERRAAGGGGSLDQLIEDLPRILAGDAPRTAMVHSRLPGRLDPPETAELGQDFPELQEDATLANVPRLSDGELTQALVLFERLEREISGIRKELHGVINTIKGQLARRLNDGDGRPSDGYG
jgi:hypothetical protein